LNSFILEAKKRAEVCLFYGQVLLKIYAYWKIGNEQNRLRVKSGFDGIVFLVSKDARVQNFDKTMKLNEYNAFDFAVSLVSIFSYLLAMFFPNGQNMLIWWRCLSVNINYISGYIKGERNERFMHTKNIRK
jgi:hypothetical protein